MKSYVGLRWIVAAALLPLVMLGLYVLAMQIHGLMRYDPALFTDAYREKYETAGAVARALEGALQTGDQELLAELQGQRQPAALHTDPSLIFVMLWELDNRYLTYLYFDMETYERHLYYMEEIEGRWVASAPDLYYYLHSGRWLVAFVPLAIAWWVLVLVVVLAVWLYRLSARMREQMYGG